MTLTELGALGEFIGAMEESRRLALAQTYQMRADALQEMLVHAADSEHIGAVITKLTEAGYPEDLGSLDELDAVERGRFRLWQIAQQTHWDNMFYQYQQGFLDDEYYDDSFRDRVRRLAPVWQALNVRGSRRSFVAELERLLAEVRRGEGPS